MIFHNEKEIRVNIESRCDMVSSLGFDELQKRIRKSKIKACLIEQDGQNIFTFFKNRKIESAVHPINSCTKSVISMLIGICIQKGLIENVHMPINEYFGDYYKDISDIRKEGITIYHLLTMTPGFDWPEFGEWNFGSPMEYSKDMIRFILDRELTDLPGSKMIYNSGCSNLLSAIIQIVSGMKTIDFAYSHLFSPLGVQDIVWHEKQGINLGANGLKMKPGDMLALGRLYLNDGLHENKQIIAKDWITESILARFETYRTIGHYGYHWWVSNLKSDNSDPVAFYFAMGLFGQFIVVVPAKNMIAVFISENYSDTMKPLLYFRDFIGKSL